MRIPAICRVCGRVSPAPINVPIGSRIVTRRSTTDCLWCGAEAAIIDGGMQMLDDGIRLFSGPDFTRDVLAHLGMLVDDVRSGRATPAQAADRMSRKHRLAGEALRGWLGLGIAFAALMVSVGSLVLNWRDTPSNRTVDEVVEEAVEGYYETIPPADSRQGLAPSANQPTNQASDSQPDTEPDNAGPRKGLKKPGRRRKIFRP